MANPGWQCPGCGRCYAPWRGECQHCPPVKSVGANTTEQDPWRPDAAHGPGCDCIECRRSTTDA